jgi:hypothetical protein
MKELAAEFAKVGFIRIFTRGYMGITISNV